MVRGFRVSVHKIGAMVPPAPEVDAASPPPPQTSLVGVVVLNWNSAWFTRRCLRSLAAQDYPADRMRVVLADNGSVDGSREELAAWLARPGSPDVELIDNGSNLGFAEGCNRAIRHLLEPGVARVDHVALLNNDAWAEPGWLRALVEVMEAYDNCAAVSSRLLLEPGFAAVEVDSPPGRIELKGARVAAPDGTGSFDVLDRVRTDGFSDEGALEWPARRIWQLAAGSSGTVWLPAGPAQTASRVTVAEPGGPDVDFERSVGAGRTTLLNGLGTGINESGEGFDIGYAEPDPWAARPTPPDAAHSEVVDGFCGGSALLRVDALEQVGLFDPAFFAYYEDTDLSWRLRNAGWEVRTAPASVAHHAFGASGGGGSRWHLFLDRRNWLVTNFRNGDGRAVKRALGWLWRGAWRLFRVNIFGKARRGQRIQVEPFWTWKKAAIAASLRIPGARRQRRPGWSESDRVRGLFQPGGSPKAPEPWPGGPLVVYVDVGETIKAGYRAGIQRVVCALVTHLPAASNQLEVVPIRWNERNGGFRRVTAEEYESLLRAGGSPELPDEPPAVAGVKAALRSGLGRLGVLGAVRRRREQVFGKQQRELEDSLMLNRLEPGAVLLEVDAVWNELEVDRGALLADLRRSGVHVASFIHDLLPVENPDWFAPKLRRIFDPAALAQLRESELLVCASAATREQIQRVADDAGIQPSPVSVVPLATEDWNTTGRTETSGEGAVLPAGVRAGEFLLVVGTLEPRKNHALAIDVFDRLSGQFPDLQLVLAGRPGWGNDELISRIEGHPDRGGRLRWLDDVHDEELDALYRNARLVLVPSLSEGFGLPLAEALGRGVPVLASTGGALAELGGDAVEHLDPRDVDGWTAAVLRLLSDPEAHQRARSASEGFDGETWDSTAAAVADALLGRFRPGDA